MARYSRSPALRPCSVSIRYRIQVLCCFPTSAATLMGRPYSAIRIDGPQAPQQFFTRRIVRTLSVSDSVSTKCLFCAGL